MEEEAVWFFAEEEDLSSIQGGLRGTGRETKRSKLKQELQVNGVVNTHT